MSASPDPTPESAPASTMPEPMGPPPLGAADVPRADSLEAVRACARSLLEAPVRAHVELEARLGHWSGGTFTPGVSAEVFEELERDLQDSPSLQADEGWSESIDYHYVVSRKQKVRTRVTFDRDRVDVGREHVSKDRVAHATLCVREEAASACRISLSRETPVREVPAWCLPTHVRIKQRRTFRDVRNGVLVWSYELSRTWSGSSRSAVEYLQNTSEPVREVELELHDTEGAHVAARGADGIARTLCLKAARLLGLARQGELEVASAAVDEAPLTAEPAEDAAVGSGGSKRRRRG